MFIIVEYEKEWGWLVLMAFLTETRVNQSRNIFKYFFCRYKIFKVYWLETFLFIWFYLTALSQSTPTLSVALHQH